MKSTILGAVIKFVSGESPWWVYGVLIAAIILITVVL